MKLEPVILPFVLDQIKHRVRLEYFELTWLREQVKHIIIVVDPLVLKNTIFVRLTLNMWTDIWQQIDAVVDLEYLGCVHLFLFVVEWLPLELNIREGGDVMLPDHKYGLIICSNLHIFVSMCWWPLVVVKFVEKHLTI